MQVVLYNVCKMVVVVVVVVAVAVKRKKGKEEYLYSAFLAKMLFWPRWYTQSAQAWITQFYL